MKTIVLFFLLVSMFLPPLPSKAQVDENLAVITRDNITELKQLAAFEEPQFVEMPGSGFAPQAVLRESLLFTNATGEGRTVVKVWDYQTRELLEEYSEPRDTDKLAVSVDGRLVAISGDGGKVIIYDRVEGGQIEFSTPEDIPLNGIFSIALSPNGEYLAGCTLQNFVYVWDTQTGEMVGSTEIVQDNQPVYIVKFSPVDDELLLAAAAQDGTVRLLSGTELNTVATLSHGFPGESRALAFSPNGDALVTSDQYGVLNYWSFNPDVGIRGVLADYEDDIWDVEFSPDGKLLFSFTNTMQVWDTQTIDVLNNEPIVDLDVGQYPVDLAINEAGTMIAITYEDQTVKLWGVPQS
jgi:WD40 repeat protein